MVKIEKYIYLRGTNYEVRLKRISLGGQYCKSFNTLQEARDHALIITDEYRKEPNTGLYNNYCRGGNISHLHNWGICRNKICEKPMFKCNRCELTFNTNKLNLHHIDHNRYNDEDSNFEILCTYCHREHHNTRDSNGVFIQSSETIPNGSTLQVNGNGSGVQSND